MDKSSKSRKTYQRKESYDDIVQRKHNQIRLQMPDIKAFHVQIT